jgi:flagellar hook assembly protein FlgD
LSFALPEATSVELSIYNIRGQKLITLVNERKGRGEHTVIWNGLDDAGNSVVSGVYFYRFETEYKSESGRLVLVK